MVRATTVKATVCLFLAQHLWTIALFLLYALVSVRNWSRYMEQFLGGLPFPAIPLLTAHATILLFLYASITVPLSTGSAVILLVAMTACHCILCMYPYHHNDTLLAIHRQRYPRGFLLDWI